MSEKSPSETEIRKRRHLEAALSGNAYTRDAGFERVELPYDALFEVSESALDTQTRIGGETLRFPLMIGAMTGGTPVAAQINDDLRAVARGLGIAVELGSIRALLENPDCRPTYGADCGGAVFANIGIAELAAHSPETIQKASETIGAKGIFVHLNYVQEWVQKGGNRQSGRGFELLDDFCRRASFPVFVKEVGAGIGGKCAQRLAKLPIAGIETAGRGGTSWALVEASLRTPPLPAECVTALKSVGYRTPECIIAARKALKERAVIASGGIETPLDAVKSLALGADAVAMALPILRHYAESGRAGLLDWLTQFIDVSKLIWRSAGARNLDALKGVLSAESFGLGAKSERTPG